MGMTAEEVQAHIRRMVAGRRDALRGIRFDASRDCVVLSVATPMMGRLTVEVPVLAEMDLEVARIAEDADFAVRSGLPVNDADVETLIRCVDAERWLVPPSQW